VPKEERKSGHVQIPKEKRQLLLATCLHASDVSNPCKPRGIMLPWTRRVLAEFWAQGDEERRLQVDISPLCDRDADNSKVPQVQLGFINYVVKPLYSAIATLIPEAGNTYLDETRTFWEEKRDANAGYEDIFGEPLDDTSWIEKTFATSMRRQTGAAARASVVNGDRLGVPKRMVERQTHVEGNPGALGVGFASLRRTGSNALEAPKKRTLYHSATQPADQPADR
jgi:hypothetical protein